MAVLSPTWAPPVVATAVIHAGVPDIYHSFIHSFKNRNLYPSWRLWFGGAAGRYLNNHWNKCKITTVTSAMKERNLDPWNTVKEGLCQEVEERFPLQVTTEWDLRYEQELVKREGGEEECRVLSYWKDCKRASCWVQWRRGCGARTMGRLPESPMSCVKNVGLYQKSDG